jgi:1,4-dihydroxy-2-naphthoate octaprenyltransferase
MGMAAVANFLSYVEITTKIASVFPFLVGAGYTLYRYGRLDANKTVLFFVAMLLFDLTVTALNNHIGHRQTGRKPHYTKAVSIALMLVMSGSSALLGVYLAAITDIAVLLAGLFCFAAGILYSCGPLPITRTPFGELLSGSVQGFCIPFIVLEINRPIVGIAFQMPGLLAVEISWIEALYLILAAMPLALCIANIMLANNLCDLEEDIAVQRFTLPYYIGVHHALLLYRLLYLAVYAFIAVSCVLRVVPAYTAAVLLTAIPVKKNVRRFLELQDKRQTFVMAIINFLTILVPYAICIWIGGIIRLIVG